MNLSDYRSCDGLALAELIRTRAVSRREVLEAALSAIERFNPTLNAFMNVYPDVVERGDEGLPDASFAGVPFALKDLACHEAGRLQECGSRLFRGAVMPHDTDLMQRFKAAGLVNLGRTPTPEMGWNVTTEPLLHGPVRNPWSLAHSTGGSSGGAAAAVAAGLLPLAHATDGAGSIRIPAACCGLVGLKPTRGRIPTGPDMGDPINGLGIEFAVTRTVRDCAALLDCVARPGAGEYLYIPHPAGSFTGAMASAPGRLRIAWTTKAWSGAAVDMGAKRVTQDTAQLCRDLGHEVEEASPAFDAEAFLHATTVVWSANLAAGIEAGAAALGRTVDTDLLEAAVRACYEFGRECTARDLLGALAVFNGVCRSIGPFFERYDILLTPTVAGPAPLLGVLDANAPGVTAHGWTERILGFAPFTAPWNTTGQPAVSLPAGFGADELPLGVQFVGRFADEATLLGLAAQFEAARPWPRVAPLPAAAPGAAARTSSRSTT